MTSKEYLIDLLKENGVFLEGDFTLSSGKKSNYYINMKKAITEPEILSTISKLITQKIDLDDIDKVAGPALGAVPIATAVSLESKLPLLMIRKEKKGYGTSKLIEGELNEGDNVIVVEDVSTTGGSLLKAIRAVWFYGKDHPTGNYSTPDTVHNIQERKELIYNAFGAAVDANPDFTQSDMDSFINLETEGIWQDVLRYDYFGSI